MWMVRESGVSFQTVSKAYRGEEIRDKSAAEKLSAATRGAVSVATLMHIRKRSVPPAA